MKTLNPYQSIHCENCLQKSKFVKHLNKTELDLYNQNSKDVNFQANEIIFKAKRPANHIVYIRSGFAKEVIDLPNNNSQICRIIGPGNYIGLNALLQEGENDTSFIAVSQISCCAIELNTLLKIIHSNIEFSAHFLKTYCIDLKHNYHHFIRLNQKAVISRVAEMLVYFSQTIYQKTEFTNYLSRDEMSSFIQTGKESYSRAITKLKENKIIKVNGKNVRIIDLQKLIQISNDYSISE